MDNSDIDNKISEMIKLFKDNDDNSEKYKSVIQFLEDYKDELTLDNFEIYKKAYKNNRIKKCIEVLINIGIYDSINFKRRFLLVNALINPFSHKFTKDEYNKTMLILNNTIDKSKSYNLKNEFIHELEEMLFYTKLFYENNESNTNRLVQNSFFSYSLLEQLRMICIYLQDQSRMMQNKVNENIQKKNSISCLEGDTTYINNTYVTNNQTSVSDNYETTLEIYNILIQYLFYIKSEETNLNVRDILPYEKPTFEEISIIAYQRMMFLKLEEKFRYSKWTLSYGINEYNKDTYLFEANSKNQCLAHLTAIYRRQIQYGHSMILHYSFVPKNVIDLIKNLALSVDINNFELFKMSISEYNIVKENLTPMRLAVKNQCKPYFEKCTIGDLSVEDLLDGYVFLNVISNIYITACMKQFNQNLTTTYQYLAPLISLSYLINLYSELNNVSTEKAKNILYEFVYDKKTNTDEGDIFTRPLIKPNNNSVILCQTLIEQMNMNRNIEKALQRKKVSLKKTGTDYEKYIIDKLKSNKHLKVNTNKIEFLAYDNKNVEFDFLGTLDDYLLLIECKSLLTPYGDKELYDRKKTIHEGVEQVLRRVNIVQNDWDKIKESVNIELPSEPYPIDKIIKLVCTDIYDFTTLIIEGVRITDDSTLLKYLTDPIISKVELNKNRSKITPKKNLWKSGKPNPKELIAYLDKPDTVSYIANCIHEQQKPISYFSNDNCIIFKDFYLDEDPFEKEILGDNMQSTKKIYPNEKCPCGSNKKYKKCCGNKQNLM